jgi:hypothetical protein
VFQPTQLPAIRDEMLGMWANGMGAQLADAMPGNRLSPERRAMSGEQIAVEEQTRLNAADLFFVGADMAQLALAASGSLPEFALKPQDLPAPYGLILYDEVLETLDSTDAQGRPDRMFMIGVNWGTEAATKERPAGVWLTWLQHRDLWLEFATEAGRFTAREAQRMRERLPRVFLNHQAHWPFEAGETIDSFSPPDSDQHYDLNLEKVLKTTWLLMGQPVGEVSTAQLSRNERRRMERKNITPPEIRVITLRRPASSSSADDPASGREYQHQWIVRGHWRNQWYPSVQDHRPVWIAPHIKGPEGAPFLGGEKVHHWTR